MSTPLLPALASATQLSSPLSLAGLSPVMAQYCQLKQDYPDSLLFFRMGDFYELFFEDAVVAARDLNIALTKRGKKGDDDIPMCGVPAHTSDSYVAKLIEKGHKVAICEQIEDAETAKNRGAKGPLKRDVIRLVTAGTIVEEGLLSAQQHNFLLAFSPLTRKAIGVAVIDLSTGAFLIEETTLMGVSEVLARLNPAEILIPDRLVEDPALYDYLRSWKRQLTPLPHVRFDEENGRRRLHELFQVKTLDGFGHFSSAQIRAAGVLVDYINITQKSAFSLLDRPRLIQPNSILMIDPATRKSLELDRTLSGQRKGALLDTIDRTVTAAGSRLLSLRLACPLTQPSQIQYRLDMVEFFVNHADCRHHVRQLLKICPDIERSLSRLSLGRGSPRDLAAVRDGLRQAEGLKEALLSFTLPLGLQKDSQNLGHHLTLIDRLERALSETLPIHARDGGFIAPGYHEGLDTFKDLRDNSRDLVEQLQIKYAALSVIPTLKIKHNNVLGYHIDITPSYASRVPSDFIHRQTLASSLRYSTVELADLEKKIEAAARQALDVEIKLFADLVSDVQGQIPTIILCCRALASLDVTCALAELAVENHYCRPVIDQSLVFQVEKGQHPVVANVLKSHDNTPFVSNDCSLTDQTKLLLLTGPNMAGKSTYLRQNALLVIMAQMGSYIPAKKGHIGVVDRLFSRVGAADDLASGKSTFMVEMIETASILHQATERSFVILDEIGRGTSTFDGLSIAWAVVESLCESTKCRSLFATHYHELTSLAGTLPMLECLTMQIKEWNGKVVFMHEVIPGTADKSYGIHVAALAGLPEHVLKRAEQVLQTLENKDKSSLTIPPAEKVAVKPSKIEEQLRVLDVDNLAPREALDIIYKLKSEISL